MNTNKIYKGVFWISTEPNNHKTGLLRFLHDTAYVELIGSFDKDPFNIKTKRRTEICCIHGVLDNGRCCILKSCTLKMSDPFSGVVTTFINFDYLFYSTNRELIEKRLSFSKIEINLNTLFHWTEISSVESFRNEDNSHGVNYKTPLKLGTIYEDDKFEIKLNHISSFPITTAYKKISIEQDTSLILILKSNENISEAFVLIEKIHDLFILFNADKVELDNTLHLITSTNKENFYCYSNIKRFSHTKAIQNHEFGNLFTYNELSESANINAIFEKWFSLYFKLNYPIEMLISCLSDVNMSDQHKFMNLIYALEYITVKDLDNELSKVFFAKADQKILDEIEKIIGENESNNHHNFLNSLKARLSKNRRLSDKFYSYLEQLNLPIQELFKEELQVFIEKIVNTRNHFAHVNNKEPRIETESLYFYNIKLEAILVIIFCLKLGLPLEKIKLKIKMHDRFQRVIK